MNVFFLDPSPKTCAQYHVNKHVNKMCTETAQILSTAHRVLDGIESTILSKSNRRQKVWTLPDERESHLYKATHINHPSTKWARHCGDNYAWLSELWIELLKEYTFRYGKRHACEKLIPYLIKQPQNISTSIDFSPPWRAMPEEFKVDRSIEDFTLKSYRAYYNGCKSHLFSWKNREIPDWIKIQ